MTYAVLLHHLWQSTACILIAWALTLALRKNRAAVRHWLWLAASLKFLVPLSLLVSLGSQFGLRTATSSAQPQLSVIVNQISGPAGFAPVTAVPVSTAPDRLPAVLFGLWFCGVAIALLVWFRSWWHIRAVRRAATPLDLSLPIPVMSSSARLEPGVFGVFRPVLLLPEGIATRLTPDQLQTVLAHELCHVRRRDNLTAVPHMLVETLFWFHPLVWWIGSRLADERERACDEAVLQIAGEPEVYAEGILQVCRLYLESPIACMSGISGADLRARVQRIMSGGRIHNISFGRKVLLVSAALAVAGVPILIGVLTPRVGRAESQAATASATASERFEVASVKPSKSTSLQHIWTRPNGYSAVGISVTGLIFNAYGISPDLISGAPRWADSARFDIDAKMDRDAAVAYQKLSSERRELQLQLILQSLLTERFNLKAHHEAKDLPIYVLVVAKGGSRLKESTVSETRMMVSPHGRITSEALPVSSLVFSLSDIVGRPVVDQTELAGKYDINLQWEPDKERTSETRGTNSSLPPSESGPSIFTAVQEQLGLKLKSTKGPVDTIVVDHVEMPSEN